jgi:hypothetical protein
VLLTGLLLVNTGMLSQIIRDLGFIPQTYSFLGVPLYVLFALLLTLIEAGVGAVHATTTENGKITILPGVIFLLAGTIACVEGFFYSQVAPDKKSLIEFPFIGYQMKQGQLLFLWGFALVMILFLLGSRWYRALETVKRGNALTEAVARFRQLENGPKAYAEALERGSGALGKARELADTACHLLDSVTPKALVLRSNVGESLNNLGLLEESPPSWAHVSEEPLSTGDVHHLAHRAILSLCFILLGAAIFVFEDYRIIFHLYPELSPLLCITFALGLLVIFLGTGFLIRAGEKIVSGTGGERPVISAPLWNRAFGVTLTILLVAAYGIVVWRVRMPRIIAVAWMFNLLLGLCLEALGYHFYPLLSLGGIWIRKLWNVAASIFDRLQSLIMRCVLAVIIVFEYFALLFAAPIHHIFRRPIT